MNSDFSPAWFLPGAHLQTIWGRMTRRRRMVSLSREVVETPDGDELVLDHLEPRLQEARHFILLHGLEGSSNSVYIQGILSLIERNGDAATAVNFRSCARDPRSTRTMLPNRRPRFYHSGETGDFDFVVRTLTSRHPHRRFLAFGASLGGNVLLKWLGEHPGQQLIAAAATISTPYDLGAGSLYLEKSAAGRLYVSSFLATLKQKVAREDIAGRVDAEAVRRARTFREFDECATGPLHGFTGADDYYRRASSIAYLDRITTPVLAVNAEDDPFLPAEALARAKSVASPHVEFLTTRRGGHVGFIRGSAPWKCEYWAEELVVRWLSTRVGLRIED
jgi:predicted alpha/beta-fold hydrolase